MNQVDLIKSIGPYETGPVSVDVKCNYVIPFLGSITYTFIFSSKRLGLSWDVGGGY